jgi:hypothetical protein
MYNTDYIGYKNTVGDTAAAAATTAASCARVFATGGVDISADIACALSAANLFTNITAHPAADARDFISNLKPKLAAADTYNRLTLLIAGDEKINKRAKDVSARELVLWYRGAYPNDYKTLSVRDKQFFNNYLLNAANQNTDVNQASRDYKAAMFTPSELNYNATPTESIKNIFTPVGGKINYVLYGALAIGAILLIKYIKK